MRYATALCFLVTAAVWLAAQTPAELPEVSRFGPTVGEAVPDFSLVDQNGQQQTLKSILGPNGAMLVFNRSADW